MDDLVQNKVNIDFNKRKKIAWIVFAIIFLCFLVSIFYYFFFYRFYQSTDNAYVQADITWIMPKVSGEVREVKIKDNQFVKSGDILAVLDNRDYQARYDQAKSLVQLKEAALDVLSQNEKSAQSSIEEAYSGFQAAQADFNRLKKDFNRYLSLFNDGVITRQNFESIQSQYISANAQISKSKATVNSAKSQLGSLQASRAQILAEIENAKASLNLFKVDLDSTHVITPVTGKVGNLGIRLGSRVTPQTRLMGIIPVNSIFIQANFKETQIEKIRIGQKVKLKLDAYPSLTFSGKIQSFSPASGATFSLMPPDNATGNFNKVVQRIPIRISIDSSPHENLIKPGMSVVATVDLRS